jgi:hypothetical protein
VSTLHYALMIAVAVEAAVIAVLAMRLRRNPGRVTYVEPMPWEGETR